MFDKKKKKKIPKEVEPTPDPPPSKDLPPSKEETGTQPNSIDRFNYGSNLLGKALVLSKQNGFASVALSFTDLEFLQQVVNAGISAAAQYSNLTTAILKRDPVVSENLANLLKTTEHLTQQLGFIKMGLKNSLDLSEQLVRSKEAVVIPAESITIEESKDGEDAEN